MALSTLVFAAVHHAAAQTLSEQFDGTLQIVWGDPHPESGASSDLRYSLATSDGRVYPLAMPENAALSPADFGRRVVISGHRAEPTGIIGSAGVTETIVVERLATPGAPQSEFASQSLLGARKVIFVLVKFADDASVPHPPIFYTDLTNPLTPPAGEPFPTTINGFFSKTSWNQFSWQGYVAGVGGLGAPGGWLTLPQPKSYYAPCGWSTSCANLNALSTDAIALAKGQGISFTPYDNINFVLSNDLDCCAWGGSYSVDGKSFGATWEPPWGQEAGTYSHEMGHSLGLPHSGWAYYAYDSPWDMMSARASASSTLCGSYPSKNDGGGARNVACTEPGNGYIAPHKDVLGWIPPANVASVTTSSAASYTLDGGALPLGSPLKLLKICLPSAACSGSGSHYVTVEARVKAQGATSQFDNAIPHEGILIQDVQIGRPAISGSCYFNNQSGWAVPIDSTPGDYNSSTCSYTAGTALFNAQWSPGQTYTSAAYGFDVSVVSRSGSSFTVSVTPTGMTAPAAFGKVSPANAASGQPTSVTLSWAASSGAGGYDYCYDTTNDNACSSWTSVGGLNTSATISGLSAGATYYWQVRATNVKGITYADGSATAFRSFSTAGVPAAFNKVTPANGATGQATSISLTWGTSNGATGYQYCIDTTNDSACSTWTDNGTGTSVSLSLAVNTTYYWHVRAINSVGTTSSNGSATAFWSFATIAAAPPAFSKTSPATTALLSATTPNIDWASSNGATSYEYCYDTTNNNTCDAGWTSAGTSVSAAVTGVTVGTTYYWQVRAKNSVGTTNANNGVWWSFAVPVAATVTTTPAGGVITVDGVNYVGPQTMGWAVGSQHTISIANMQVRSGVRYFFASWSDSGARSHTVTAPSSAVSYVATLTATATQVRTPGPSASIGGGIEAGLPLPRPVASGPLTMPESSAVEVPRAVSPVAALESHVAPVGAVPPSPESQPTAPVVAPALPAPIPVAVQHVAARQASDVRRVDMTPEFAGGVTGSGVSLSPAKASAVLQWSTHLEQGAGRARLHFASRLPDGVSSFDVWIRSGGEWRLATRMAAASGAAPADVDLGVVTGDVIDLQLVIHGAGVVSGPGLEEWRAAAVQVDASRTSER